MMTMFFMKKYLIFLFVFFSIKVFSQPWPGYNSSLYAGIHAISYQPEIHSVMPADWDINVLSTNLTFFNENFFGWDPIGDIKKGNIHNINDIFQNHTGVIKATINFPSLAVRLNDKSTFGFAWNLHGLLFSNISNSELSSFIDNIDNNTGEPASYKNDFAQGFLTTWSQYGISYSREIFSKNRNKLYGGITLNILSGKGSAYIDLSDLSFNYSDGVLTDAILNFKMIITEEADDIISGKGIPLFKKIGFGTDFGITYQRLKSEQPGSTYLYKLGFGITGLGKINYTNTTSISSIHISADRIDKASFSDIESITQLRDTLISIFDLEIDKTKTVASRLPLQINISGDFSLHNRFYVHVAFMRQNYFFGNERYNDLCFNKFQVVPRYESEKIGIYLPVSYSKFLDLQTGIAFRWKPLVIGSGNIFTYFFKGENSANLDIYFTTRIKINRKKQ